MSKKTTDRVSERSGDGVLKKLTYREERFVHYYTTHGNATRAVREAGFHSVAPHVYANELLSKPHILAAVSHEKEVFASRARIDRETLLNILISMATSTPGDFVEVLKDPENQEAYAGLGNKQYAIRSTKKSFKNGNEITFADRLAAVNAIWDKLGFDKDTGGKDRGTFLRELLGSVEKLSQRGKDQ